MTIQQLKYVIKTVECGSITEAARQLFISQPSLSAALKDIETEFGIEIFYRTSKGISLSPDGIEFLSYARQIVEQAELLEQRYNNKKPSKQLCSVSTQHYAEPHVFISSAHPLSHCSEVSLEDLSEYPFLAFEQGTYNSFYFSEEILSTEPHKKTIHVSDRATLFNLLIGLNGYTICSGVLNSNLNGDNIISVKLKTNETMKVGILIHKKAPLSSMASDYIKELKTLIAADGYTILS